MADRDTVHRETKREGKKKCVRKDYEKNGRK